jgi:geranylgeranyl diphosphate synthase type I
MGHDSGGLTQTISAGVAYWEDMLPETPRELVSSYLSLVEPELLTQVSRCGQLGEPARHLILAGGRRIRPLVLLGACDALGGNWTEAVQQAVAVEFIHTASLIHDDIIDHSPTRRGVATVHESMGMRTALLAGDALCFLAVELSAAAPGVPVILAQACREMCLGEAMGEGLEAAEKKTASLFRAAAEIGALMACAAPAEVADLRQYGHMLGMAFQLRDDQLDGEGTADPMLYAQLARTSVDGLPAGSPRGLLRDLATFAARRAK